MSISQVPTYALPSQLKCTLLCQSPGASPRRQNRSNPSVHRAQIHLRASYHPSTNYSTPHRRRRRRNSMKKGDNSVNHCQRIEVNPCPTSWKYSRYAPQCCERTPSPRSNSRGNNLNTAKSSPGPAVDWLLLVVVARSLASQPFRSRSTGRTTTASVVLVIVLAPSSSL